MVPRRWLYTGAVSRQRSLAVPRSVQVRLSSTYAVDDRERPILEFRVSQDRDSVGWQGNGDRCPFVPGRGKVPPYLAGRASHQRIGRDFLDSIQTRISPESDLVLYGPRGTGKTAMLGWLEAAARQRNIDVVSLASADIKTNEELVARLSRHPKWVDRLESVSWRGLGWKAREGVADQLDQVLARRLRNAPLALLIDEAHTLDPVVGHTILSTTQHLAREDAPLVTVLAGTPGLPDLLRKMEATFWERSQILLFDRLGDRDASDAVRIPFEEAGRTISSGALNQVVSESQGYPFFLQVWGKALWGTDGRAMTCRQRGRYSRLDGTNSMGIAMRNSTRWASCLPQLRWPRPIGTRRSCIAP